MGLVFFLRNKLNVSVSKIECEEKKKKLTLAQMSIVCEVDCLWPQVVLGLLCVVVGVSVDGVGVMGRERREEGHCCCS